MSKYQELIEEYHRLMGQVESLELSRIPRSIRNAAADAQGAVEAAVQELVKVSYLRGKDSSLFDDIQRVFDARDVDTGSDLRGETVGQAEKRVAAAMRQTVEAFQNIVDQPGSQ